MYKLIPIEIRAEKKTDTGTTLLIQFDHPSLDGEYDWERCFWINKKNLKLYDGKYAIAESTAVWAIKNQKWRLCSKCGKSHVAKDKAYCYDCSKKWR